MWYTGTAELNATIPVQTSIAYATSSDGIHWTKYSANPVFTGFTEFGGAYTAAWWPSVAKVNGTYLMAFGDGNFNVGYATSTDGIAWSFSNATQVLLTVNGWHNGTIIEPSILVDGSRLLLWYSGTEALANHTVPYIGGVGFATCGALVVLPAVTKTVTTVSTQTATRTATETTTQTATQTTISISSTTATVTTATTQTVTYNPSAPVWQVAEGLAVGAFVALVAAVVVVTVRGRTHKRGPAA